MISFIGGGKPKTTDMSQGAYELYHIMLYRMHIAMIGFELKMLVVIGTDCTSRCKSKYHAITIMTPPYLNDINIDNYVDFIQVPFIMVISLKMNES